MGADLEITAIDALTNAKLEVDRALDMASKTLHPLLEEIPVQNSTISETSESTLRCTRAKPTPRLPAANWVLKPHEARFVLRGFEEDVKDEDVFASTTMTAFVRKLLSQATDLRSEWCTVFTADVKTAFLNAHMKDGDVGVRKAATRVAAGNSGSPERNSDQETTEKSLWSEERAETLAAADPQEVWLRPGRAWQLLVDPRDEASITRTPCGRLSVGWHAPDLHCGPH